MTASTEREEHQKVRPNGRALLQIQLLTVQFLLGMLANFIGSGVNGWVLAVGITVVVLHIVVAIALVVISVMMVVVARRTGEGDARMAQLGAVILAVTFVTGILTLITGSNWWSYAMSVGFIGVFLIYGKMYVDGRIAQASTGAEGTLQYPHDA
jgi:hypothetical protein